MPARRVRKEVATIAQNPNLQLIGSDPAGGAYDLGIFIGANGNATAPTQRQLYVLAAASFNAGQRGRIVGLRQYLTIGVQQPVTAPTGPAFYLLERPVETPTWHFTDANVLWGLRKVPPQLRQNPSALNGNGLAFQYATTPAQLVESIGGGIITPPYGGSFPGNVLTPEFGRFFDLRCRRWAHPIHMDIEFEGPCDIVLFASVQQSNPATRTPPAPSEGGSPPLAIGLQFNGTENLPANSTNVQYYVVTTAGIHASIGDLIFDNGTNTGIVTVQAAAVGQTFIPTTNLTGGTISFNAQETYQWNGTSWIPVSDTEDPGQYLTTEGTVPEDAFIQNYSGATYVRIAGSIIFEYEEQAPTGAPKTYRDFGSADRITRDTTETGDNTMRQSAEVTNKHLDGWVKRYEGLGKLPENKPDDRSKGVIARIAQRWQKSRPAGSSSARFRDPTPPPAPREGLGHLPDQKVQHSMNIARALAAKYQQGVGREPDEHSMNIIRMLSAKYRGSAPPGEGS